MASNVRNLSGSLLKIDWSCCLEILEAWGYKRLLVVTSECVVSGGLPGGLKAKTSTPIKKEH